MIVIGTILNEGGRKEKREGERELKLINRISLSCGIKSTDLTHMALESQKKGRKGNRELF